MKQKSSNPRIKKTKRSRFSVRRLSKQELISELERRIGVLTKSQSDIQTALREATGLDERLEPLVMGIDDIQEQVDTLERAVEELSSQLDSVTAQLAERDVED